VGNVALQRLDVHALNMGKNQKKLNKNLKRKVG